MSTHFEPSYLLKVIIDNGVPKDTLAKCIGQSRKHLNSILAGKARITAETALRLERALGISAQTWLRLQEQEDLRIARMILKASNNAPKACPVSLQKRANKALKIMDMV